MRQAMIWILQLCASILALYLSIRQIEWHAIIEAVSKLSLFTFIGVFLLYNFSQILSAVRSLYYLNAIGIQLTHSQNIALYYLGMFYNIFLPGAVGGDGYKVYMLKKYFSKKTLQLIQVLLLDRLNGFLGLLFITLLFVQPAALSVLRLQLWMALCFVGVCVGIFTVFQYYCVQIAWRNYLHTLILSVLSQGLQVGAALWIVFTCDHNVNFYLFGCVFILSTIFSQLPISLGGMGTRELTAVYCLQWLGLDITLGLLMGSIFFLVQTISNSIGVFFIPLKLVNTQIQS